MPTVVYWCMAATHTKKIKHSMLCVAGVYLIDIVDKMFVILHVNVSRLSICCSCWDFFFFRRGFSIPNWYFVDCRLPYFFISQDELSQPKVSVKELSV